MISRHRVETIASPTPDDVLAGDEGHLQVDLGELRLPVLAEVLVAEAAGELVVALKAADHEQLLEQLRRLRQGVPVAGAQPDGDEEVAGAFRRGPGEVRRLHVHEPVVAHHVGQQVGGRGADAQRAGGLLAADVQVAVLDPDVLAELSV